MEIVDVEIIVQVSKAIEIAMMLLRVVTVLSFHEVKSLSACAFLVH